MNASIISSVMTFLITDWPWVVATIAGAIALSAMLIHDGEYFLLLIVSIYLFGYAPIYGGLLLSFVLLSCATHYVLNSSQRKNLANMKIRALQAELDSLKNVRSPKSSTQINNTAS